jgi:hypothetical protein
MAFFTATTAWLFEDRDQIFILFGEMQLGPIVDYGGGLSVSAYDC